MISFTGTLYILSRYYRGTPYIVATRTVYTSTYSYRVQYEYSVQYAEYSVLSTGILVQWRNNWHKKLLTLRVRTVRTRREKVRGASYIEKIFLEAYDL